MPTLNGNDFEVLEPAELANESTRSDNSYHVVTGSGADETAVLDGFVITGGNANGSGNFNGGGMINVSGSIPANPTLVNCTFHGNSAGRKGGGMYNKAGTPTLIDCVFSKNHTNGATNQEGGGGMYNQGGSPTLRNCRFVGNTATNNGAGLFNMRANPTIIDTAFDGNVIVVVSNTHVGGGILNNSSNATIINCMFTGNSARRNEAVNPGDGAGGGVQNWGGGTNPTVVNCTFSENTAVDVGGGLAANAGARAVVSNCIFWGNRARNNANEQIGGAGGDPTVVTYSCVQGGKPGEGNISLDPLFMDADGPDNIVGTADDDLRPWPHSPCIDAGDDSALPIDITDMDGDGDIVEPIPFDFDGNPRISGFSVDIGACESATERKAWPYVYGPDPDDGTLHEDTWVGVSWKPGQLAVSHNVYFGDNFDVVENDDTTGETFRGNETATFYVAGFPGFAFPDGLVPGTTYYWRIDEVNEAEPNSPWKGEVWSFSIPPKTAYNPDPADGTGFVDTNATLTWTPGLGAGLHTVYFGDSFDDVDNAVGGAPLTSVTYDPGPLEPGNIYYWRVDESDGIGTYKGNTWSFTTTDFSLVDSLEGSSNGLSIGTGNAMAPGTYFSGLIDDIRIYDRVVRP
jgi:hypothetical protein